MTDETKESPPPNAKHVWRVSDLSQDRDPAQYEVRNGDEKPRIVTVSKRQRQILDLLIQSPVFCASPVRISDIVHVLRREIDLAVTTTIYSGDPQTGAGDFGVYTLVSKVRRLDDLEVAA